MSLFCYYWASISILEEQAAEDGTKNLPRTFNTQQLSEQVETGCHTNEMRGIKTENAAQETRHGQMETETQK